MNQTLKCDFKLASYTENIFETEYLKIKSPASKYMSWKETVDD